MSEQVEFMTSYTEEIVIQVSVNQHTAPEEFGETWSIYMAFSEHKSVFLGQKTDVYAYFDFPGLGMPSSQSRMK